MNAWPSMHATSDSVGAAVARRPHAHAYPTDMTFDAYLGAGGYSLLNACVSGARTRDDARRYFDSYAAAIAAISRIAGGIIAQMDALGRPLT